MKKFLIKNRSKTLQQNIYGTKPNSTGKNQVTFFVEIQGWFDICKSPKLGTVNIMKDIMLSQEIKQGS